MKKKLFKTVFILSLIFCTLFINVPSAYASALSDIVTGAQNFIELGDSEQTGISTEKIQDMSDLIYNTLFIIAVVLAVGIGIFIGIQFITSGVAQKAKIKETLIAYVAGCIVIFGSFTIWKIIVTLLQST